MLRKTIGKVIISFFFPPKNSFYPLNNKYSTRKEKDYCTFATVKTSVVKRNFIIFYLYKKNNESQIEISKLSLFSFYI